jgi:hypothetical protein
VALEQYNQDLMYLTDRYFASTVQILSKLAEYASLGFYFMVPFLEKKGYIGKLQVHMFVKEMTSTEDTLKSHISIALCGLGGVGYVS